MHVLKSAHANLNKGEKIELVRGDYVKVYPSGRKEIIIAGRYTKSVDEVLGLKKEDKPESKKVEPVKTPKKTTTSKKK